MMRRNSYIGKQVGKQVEEILSDPHNLIEELRGHIEVVDAYFKDRKKVETTTLVRAFLRLREFNEALKAISKQLNCLNSLAKELFLPERFEQDGVTSLTVDGYRVTISSQLRASIKGGMKEAAYEWLRENEYGDLIVETVNASTLSSFARSLVEENKDLPDNIFNQQVFNNTSVTAVETSLHPKRSGKDLRHSV